MPILSDDNFYHHRKMLFPQRRRPMRKARHIDWVQTHARDPVAEWTNRVLRRYKVRVIHMRNELNGFHAQLQVRLATIRDIHFLREVTPLKRHDSVVDGLEPTPPPVVTKDWTVGFKTILGWVANPRVSFNQNALKFVAAKSALHISSMKTLKRIIVGERGNYLCPNL